MEMTISKETQGYIACLQSCNALYEQVENALIARYGSDRVAADILAADGGFREKWLSLCEVVKGYLSDAVFENVCESADAI